MVSIRVWPASLLLGLGTDGYLGGGLAVGGATRMPTGCGPMVRPIATALVTPTSGDTTPTIPSAPALTGVHAPQYVELRHDDWLAWSNAIVATL